MINSNMAKKRDKSKLNIGCGTFRKEGYWNIDKVKSPAVDEVLDIEKGLPYRTNSVDRIYCSHVVEHIYNFEFLMHEMYRVCRPHAVIEIFVPHVSNKDAFCEWHVRFFNSESFKLFTGFVETKTRMGTGMATNLFKILENRICFYRGYNPLNYLEWLVNLNQTTKNWYETPLMRTLLPAKEVHFILQVIKTEKPKSTGKS